MPTAAEPDLLARAQAGDRRALETLLAEQAPRIARFAAKMCRQPADADDVVQETLLAAARALPEFRGQSSLPTWLFAIARSQCRRQFRRAGLRADQRLDVDDADAQRDPQLADRSATADATLGDRQLAAEAASAMADLPPAQREVLVLRDIEGLTAPEVADMLGVQLATVKTRLHRARLQVRDRLASRLARADALPAAACPDIGRLYSRHLEGDVAPALCAQMQAHLQTCPHCADRCATLRSAVATCASLRTEHAPVRLQGLIRFAVEHAASAT